MDDNIRVNVMRRATLRDQFFGTKLERSFTLPPTAIPRTGDYIMISEESESTPVEVKRVTWHFIQGMGESRNVSHVELTIV